MIRPKIAEFLLTDVIRRLHSSAQRQAMMSVMGIYRQLCECFACSRSRTKKIKSSSGMAIMEM